MDSCCSGSRIRILSLCPIRPSTSRSTSISSFIQTVTTAVNAATVVVAAAAATVAIDITADTATVAVVAATEVTVVGDDDDG